MASKEKLMSAFRGKSQKKQIFRRGRGSTTSVQRPSVNREAGKEAQDVADFLGKVMKVGPAAKDAYNKQQNEDNKKLTAEGIAAYKNATPSQRKLFRDNIRSGAISGGESPYFREGLQRAQAESMSLEYGIGVMDAWNKSDAKNSSDPEAFNNFLNDYQNKAEGPPGTTRSWSERINELNEHVAVEELHPRMDAVKRQLAQQHSTYQRTQYDAKAQGVKETAFANKTKETSLTLKLAGKDVEYNLLEEAVHSDAVKTHLNVLAESKNRMSRKPNLKAKFMANWWKTGKGSKKEAEVAWNSKQREYGVEIKKMSLASTGRPHEEIFTIAAYKKEEKTFQDEVAKSPKEKVREGEFKYLAKAPRFSSGIKDPRRLLPGREEALVAKEEYESSPVESAEEKDLDFESLYADIGEPGDDVIHPYPIGSPPEGLLLPDPSDPNYQKVVAATEGDDPYNLLSRVASPKTKPKESVAEEVALAQVPEVIEDKAPTSRTISQKSVEPPSTITAGWDEALNNREKARGKKVTYSKKGELKNDWEQLIEDGTVDPKRSHYGLVAYHTPEEAEKIIDELEELSGKEQRNFFVVKVPQKGGKKALFQVQAQDGVNITQEQRDAFYIALQSKYNGELGNPKAGPREKGFIQDFPGKG